MNIKVSEENKLTVILDASAISNSACLLRLFLTTVEGYTSQIQNNDVEWGSAFHKFRAIFKAEGEKGIGRGINAAKHYFENKPMRVKSNKKYLTTEFLVGACIGYSVTYENDNMIPVRVIGEDNKEEILLECKFILPYYTDDKVEILIAGTCDEIAKIKNGIYVIPDCKTTGVWDIQEYFFSYQLSTQLHFYRWAIALYARLFPDSIYAEIHNSGDVGVLIDGVFYKGKDQPIEYKRSDVIIIKPNTIIEFEHMFHAKVQELVMFIHIWLKDKVRPPRFGILNGACNTKYGMCPYAMACIGDCQTTRDIMLERDFIKKQYNPLEHGEL